MYNMLFPTFLYQPNFLKPQEGTWCLWHPLQDDLKIMRPYNITFSGCSGTYK